MFALGLLPLLLHGKSGKQIRLEPHRTHVDALGATQTWFGRMAQGFTSAHYCDAVSALYDWSVKTTECPASHRTARQYLIVAYRYSSTCVYQMDYGGAYAGEEVGRMRHFLTTNRNVTLYERLVLHHGFVHGKGCRYAHG